MSPNSRTYTVRAAHSDDAAAMTEVLNQIIRAGGTTAMEQPLSPQDFMDHFMRRALSCVLADSTQGVLGFQWLGTHPKLPQGCADIATFTRQSARVPGVGTALFAATRATAQRIGLDQINATIRADNTGGLAFYAKMGFADHAIETGVPLSDGTPVDRISKRLSLD